MFLQEQHEDFIIKQIKLNSVIHSLMTKYCLVSSLTGFQPREQRSDQNLRTVPTFVTAHTFCASRDTQVSYGWCLLTEGYFSTV